MAAAAPHTFRMRSYVRTAMLVLASTTVGDLACQGIIHNTEKKKKEAAGEVPTPFIEFWDKKRTGIMMVNSFFVMSPIMYTINFWLEKKFPGNAMKTIGKKMAIGYLITPWTLCLTFASVNFMKGKSASEVKDKIKSDLPTTMLTGLFYWPVVQLMPFDYRPFITSFAGAVWNIYMSNQTNKPLEVEAEVADSSSF